MIIILNLDDKKMANSLILLSIIEFGIGLIILSLLFWNRCGQPIKNIKIKKKQRQEEIECLRYPPVTSLIIIFSVILMFFLISSNDICKNIFGEGYEGKKMILQMFGTIVTGTILMITIFWSMRASKIKLLQNVHYYQTVLIVLLLLFNMLSFYYILLNF